jgi:hypothetical protein
MGGGQIANCLYANASEESKACCMFSRYCGLMNIKFDRNQPNHSRVMR